MPAVAGPPALLRFAQRDTRLCCSARPTTATRASRGWVWLRPVAVSYAAGLAAGAALVGFDTDLGALALMGLVSGAALGGAQGYVLAGQGRRALALPWALAMPVLFALGWSAASITGVGVDDQFTVFGAGGALLFTLLSGLLLARFTPPGAPGA